MRASRPRSRRHSTAFAAATIERSVLINAGRAAVQELGPLAGYQKDLGTSVTTQKRWPRPCGLALSCMSTFSTWVPLTMNM